MTDIHYRWPEARFPNGPRSTGSKPGGPDYAQFEAWQGTADTHRGAS